MRDHHAFVVEMFREGHTQVEIGAKLGVSRQRVQQILVAEIGNDGIKDVYATRRGVRDDEIRESYKRTCFICHRVFVPKTWKEMYWNHVTRKRNAVITCSKRCSRLYLAAGYHLNPSIRALRKKVMAHYILRKREKFGKSQRRWAQKLLGLPQDALIYPSRSKCASESKPWTHVQLLKEGSKTAKAMQEIEELRRQNGVGA
jgi:hypothetical protein